MTGRGGLKQDRYQNVILVLGRGTPSISNKQQVRQPVPSISVSTNTKYPGSVVHVNQYFHLRLSDLYKTVDLLKKHGKSTKGEK